MKIRFVIWVANLVLSYLGKLVEEDKNISFRVELEEKRKQLMVNLELIKKIKDAEPDC